MPPELKAYFGLLLTLFRPNRVPPSLDTYSNKPGDISGWSLDELKLLIEEGRRELDGQTAGLIRVRDQARLLFSTAVALIIVMGVELRTLTKYTADWEWLLLVGWAAATALTFLALAASAAMATAAAQMSIVDTAVLSHYGKVSASGESSNTEFPVHRKLAGDYANMMKLGADSVNTLQTVFRYAVLSICLAGVLQLSVWVWLILKR
jgi:hypothetical protein